MTETNGNSPTTEPVIQPVLDFYQQYFRTCNEQARSVLDGMAKTCDMASLRRRWLEALNSSLEAYMRTPAFLDGIKRQFDAMTYLKAWTEDQTEEFAQNTGVPRITDISGLFERLRVGQEALAVKLDSIEQRLAALEKHPHKRSNGAS